MVMQPAHTSTGHLYASIGPQEDTDGKTEKTQVYIPGGTASVKQKKTPTFMRLVHPIFLVLGFHSHSITREKRLSVRWGLHSFNHALFTSALQLG